MIYHSYVVFILGMQMWFSFRKFIKKINHINGSGGKIMIISIGTKKAINKSQLFLGRK